MKNSILHILRWYCHPDFREEIQGDLLEQYHKNEEHLGKSKANFILLKEVFLLFRPSIILSFQQSDFTEMKAKQWLKIGFVNLFVVFLIMIPFLPGPFNYFSIGASGFAQFMGFLGLIFLPIGLVWTIVELKKQFGRSSKKNNWNNGFYLAILTTALFLTFYILLVVFATTERGMFTGITLSIAIIAFLYKIIPAIKRLKSSALSFNTAPIYLLTIPIICLFSRLTVAPAISDFSRNYAISNSEKVIDQLENYKLKTGKYPRNLAEISEIAKPNIMGINGYNYEAKSDKYKLSFVQWVHWGATQEVVVFDRADEPMQKGYIASFSASKPHWKYYWFD